MEMRNSKQFTLLSYVTQGRKKTPAIMVSINWTFTGAVLNFNGRLVVIHRDKVVCPFSRGGGTLMSHVCMMAYVSLQMRVTASSVGFCRLMMREDDNKFDPCHLQPAKSATLNSANSQKFVTNQLFSLPSSSLILEPLLRFFRPLSDHLLFSYIGFNLLLFANIGERNIGRVANCRVS